jgi:hypothetical protein
MGRRNAMVDALRSSDDVRREVFVAGDTVARLAAGDWKFLWLDVLDVRSWLREACADGDQAIGAPRVAAKMSRSAGAFEDAARDEADVTASFRKVRSKFA